MKYAWLVMILISTGIACKKTGDISAYILFYNGTWSLSGITVAVNGNALVSTGIAQGQASGTAAKSYLAIQAGTNEMVFKVGTNTLADNNFYTSASSGNSFLFFDTSAKSSSPALVQLTDDLTQPDTALIKYRFINASPDTTSIDLWLVNGNKDSVKLVSASSFIGKTALASSISTFATNKYHGENYTLKIKKSGSEQVLITTGYAFVVRGIYSIVFSGLAAGSGDKGLKLSVLSHQTE